MTLPTSAVRPNLSRVADAIDSQLITLKTQAKDIRERVVLKSGLPSTSLRELILALIETQRFIGSMADLKGLSGEFARRYPDIDKAFDFPTEWAATAKEIANVLNWCRALYAAVDGQPVFERFNAKTGELETYPIKFDTAAATDFVAGLDALLKTLD